MRLSHFPVIIYFRRLATAVLICAALCSPQNVCVGAEDIPHQIARVVKDLELEPAEKLTYTRRGYTSHDGSPSRYLLQLESDGTVSVYYYGGRDRNNERAYSQTYHHGKWDESCNSPAKDQRERWDAYHPTMFEKKTEAQASRADKPNPGDAGASNPYSKVAVGDWLKYELKSEYGFAPLISTCVVRVASVEGSVVKLIQTVMLDKGKEVNLDKTIDISKPLSLFELLGYDKPHEMRMEKVDEGRVDSI